MVKIIPKLANTNRRQFGLRPLGDDKIQTIVKEGEVADSILEVAKAMSFS